MKRGQTLIYAHQVIDSLQNSAKRIELKVMERKIKGFPFNEQGIQRVNAQINQYKILAKDIEKSMKFNFGDLDDLVHFFKNKNNADLFEEGKDAFRLPFELCWFEYSRCGFFSGIDAIDKYCILASESGEHGDIYISRFWHFKNGQGWTPIDARKMKINLITGDMENGETSCCKVMDKKGREDWHGLFLLKTAILLLSCKNITTQKHHPNPKLQKSRKKKGKQPLFTYHTLVIKPTGKYQESISKHLWENRIHLCRGHFKTYSADKPLFGRLTGRYWWQPAVRGRNKDGVVMKDYKVEAID